MAFESGRCWVLAMVFGRRDRVEKRGTEARIDTLDFILRRLGGEGKKRGA